MHACGDNLAQIFSAKRTTSEGSVRSDNFMAEPTKLVYAIKQAIKEGAVGRSGLLGFDLTWLTWFDFACIICSLNELIQFCVDDVYQTKY